MKCLNNKISVSKEFDITMMFHMQIFGATEEDVEKLKIVSIQEVDIDVLDSMIGSPDE